MNTQTLIEALRALDPKDMDWKFALYNTSKSRDGLELEWRLCDMKGTAAWAETLRAYLLEKPTAEKTVTEYSPFLSDKENIAAIEAGSDVIKEQISEIITNIEHGLTYAPDDFVSGTLPKAAGFGFYGKRCRSHEDESDGEHRSDTDEGDGERSHTDEGDGGKDKSAAVGSVLFMRRGNPFITGPKLRVCIADGDTVTTYDKPVLKFTPAVDFILIGGVCYFNSAAIEKDFELENRHWAIASRRMKLVAEADIVSDFDKLEAAALSAKNARKFTSFDEKILEHITRMGAALREEFLATYGVTVDGGGRMDTYDPEQCELIIDLLCCRSVVDPLGRLATGNNITPRE